MNKFKYGTHEIHCVIYKKCVENFYPVSGEWRIRSGVGAE